MKWFALAVLVLLAFRFSKPASATVSSPVNGGYADGGLNGEYFADANFNGSPQFFRRDIRIDFDWHGLSPGGSPQRRYHSFPANSFSIRWTGRLFPRVTGIYRFATTSDDDMRIRIRSQGAPDWSNVVEARPDSQALVSRTEGTYRFGQAGVPYEIQVEYRHRGVVADTVKTNAVARVTWTAPGLPQWEVIDCTRGFTLDIDPEAYADVVKSRADAAPWRRPNSRNLPMLLDANDYPSGDSDFRLWDNGAGREGMYGIHFLGKADLSAQPTTSGRIVSSRYNPTTNDTIALLAVAGERGPLDLCFRHTQRTATSAPSTGITRLHIQRPLEPGSDTPTGEDVVFTPGYEQQIPRFAVVRFPLRAHPTSYDDQIALANETGKALYLCLPGGATDADITRAAKHLRYGADDDGPYSEIITTPKHPPLNPNLMLYLECDGVPANLTPPDQQHLTFDGQHNPDILRLRRQALRTREIGDLFRNVFVADAIGSRVRIVLRWPNTTIDGKAAAAWELDCLEDAASGAPARAVADYLWGGGPEPASAVAAASDDSAVAGPLIPGGLTGFVQGVTSLGQPFTLPAKQISGVYAVRFHAAQRRRPDRLENDRENFDVLIDGHLVSAPPAASTATVGYHPTASPGTYETLTFTDSPGSKHTITFLGRGPNGNDKASPESAEISDVELLSVDALFANTTQSSAIGNDKYAESATIARQYGLHAVLPNAGGELASAAELTPIQQAALDNDPRSLQAADASFAAAIDLSGGGPAPDLEIFGPRPPWSRLDTAETESLPRAIDAANGTMPAEKSTAIVVRHDGSASFYDLTPAEQARPAGTAQAPLEPDASEVASLAAGQSLLWEIRLPEAASLSFAAVGDQPGLRLTVDGKTPPEKDSVIYSMGTHIVRLAAASGEKIDGVHGVRVSFAPLIPAEPATVQTPPIAP